MNQKKNLRKSNPYLTSYLSLAMLCCLLLSVFFMWINLENTKRNDLLHQKEKLRLIAEDMENQMESFQKINLQISIDSLYQPFYFTRNKFFETKLLDDFTKYQSYSPLITEYFLYYRDFDYIFHSEDATVDLNIYLSSLESTKGLQLEHLLRTSEQLSFFYSPEKLFVLLPISTITSDGNSGAVLCMVIDSARLSERMQTVSGGLEGILALYTGEQLLYQNSGEALNLSSKKLVSYENPENPFSIRFLPENKANYNTSIVPLQLLLMISVIILILFISSLFAWHSYKPILMLTQKYRSKIPAPPQDILFDNKLEEINYMMESFLKNNLAANTQLEQYQELLRNQILILILNGRYSFDIKPYLAEAKLLFPGPRYFAGVLSFIGEEKPSDSIYQQLKQMLEDLTEPEEQKYIYCVILPEQNSISILCSISEELQKEEIATDIQDLAENMAVPSRTRAGFGNICISLSTLSASYLEALDNKKSLAAAPIAHEKDAARSGEGFLYNKSDIYLICCALTTGNEEAALSAFDNYFVSVEKDMPSFLMQQYLFSSFLSEVTKVSHECRIELSKQSVSLILTAKDCSQFSAAARQLIREFCSKFTEQQNRFAEDKSYQVFQYMNRHFSDYELSIESIAEALDTNASFVRSAILEHTGKKYKDYLIYLRIEYAKKLLTGDKLTVAETCQRVGYGNISYFIKAFKAQTGVTPANYKSSGSARHD